MCLLAVAAAAFLGPAACAPPPPPPIDPHRGPSTLTVVADWDDVHRSVQVAVTRAEMALIDSHITPALKRFEIQTVRAEPAWLIAQPLVDGPIPTDAAIPIRLEASVGLFGNPPAERTLLNAVANRLEELRGREWAPIRR